MKQKFISISRLFLLVIGLTLNQSCDKKDTEATNQAPVCSIINPVAGALINYGETVTISAEVEDVEGDIHEVRFFIDDKNVGSVEHFPFNYEWVTEAYSESTHIIKVIAIDAEQEKSEDEIEIHLVNAADTLLAEFNADTTSVEQGASVRFTDNSLGEPTTWEWDFGDGSSSSVKSPVHTYLENGNYSVSLSVANDHDTNTITKTDYITVSSQGFSPAADFIAEQAIITEVDTAEFIDHSSFNPTSWSWDFGDGNTSNLQNPTHFYTVMGTYTVKLTVTNEHGTDTKIKTDYLEVIDDNNPPVASFTISPSSGNINTSFTFDASGSQDVEDPVDQLEIRWDFEGDGVWDTDWETEKIITHQFDNANNYSVKMEVRDTEAFSDQDSESVIVILEPTGYFTDQRDGKEYGFIEIGTQTWMAENLNYESEDSWWYDNLSSNGDIYGRLYTWYAAMDGNSSSNSVPSGVQGICPDGWHLPSLDEWMIMIDYLGGEDVAGAKMKEAGGAHWHMPNNGASNSSGFTALPAGYRSNDDFWYLHYQSFWWTTTTSRAVSVKWKYIWAHNNPEYALDAYSIRCLKD